MPLKKLRLARRQKANSSILLIIKSLLLKPWHFYSRREGEKIFLIT